MLAHSANEHSWLYDANKARKPQKAFYHWANTTIVSLVTFLKSLFGE